MKSERQSPSLILTTFDWVPEPPRGHVRDIRVRWALEEAGLPYRVEVTSFKNRSEDHFSKPPFGQVPWLTDGNTTISESGAILLYLAGHSDVLMPSDPQGRTKVIAWLFAGLNSVEMAVLPWVIFKFTNDTEETPGRKVLDRFLTNLLQHMEQALTGGEWLTNTFSAADILMTDILRLVDRFDRLNAYLACREYVARATARPAFKKAYTDQIAFYAAAD